MLLRATRRLSTAARNRSSREAAALAARLCLLAVSRSSLRRSAARNRALPLLLPLPLPLPLLLTPPAALPSPLALHSPPALPSRSTCEAPASAPVSEPLRPVAAAGPAATAGAPEPAALPPAAVSASASAADCASANRFAALRALLSVRACRRASTKLCHSRTRATRRLSAARRCASARLALPASLSTAWSRAGLVSWRGQRSTNVPSAPAASQRNSNCNPASRAHCPWNDAPHDAWPHCETAPSCERQARHAYRHLSRSTFDRPVMGERLTGSSTVTAGTSIMQVTCAHAPLFPRDAASLAGRARGGPHPAG